MRVLIAGYGYVGQAVGAQLRRQGHAVWGLRRLAASGSALPALGIQPLIADITRPETLVGLPGPFDWVVHCVSSSGGAAEDYRRLYLEGSRNLIRWLASSPPGRIVYTSSTSVYGQLGGEWVDETSPTEPRTETGRVLLETEKMLLAAKAVILRVAGIYGPGRGYWLKLFLAGNARLEGEGQRFLNMIHRDDVAGAIVAALERGRTGEIYNAVDNEPATEVEVLTWLAAYLHRPLPPREPAAASPKKRGQTNKRISNRKLQHELGYRFTYPTFREGYAAVLAETRSVSV